VASGGVSRSNGGSWRNVENGWLVAMKISNVAASLCSGKYGVKIWRPRLSASEGGYAGGWRNWLRLGSAGVLQGFGVIES